MNTKTIQAIVNYIENHITESISLNDLSRLVNYSPYYCSANFCSYTGISIKSYIRQRRLQLAATDLKDTEARIIDIAIKYCYSSQEAFSRAFIAYFGLTPFEYRKTKLPILSFDKNSQNNHRVSEVKLMINETIKTIQDDISEKYPINVLHVLNGMCMLEDFKNNHHFKDEATYIPFNEAMCWGDAAEELFSNTFINNRIHSLNTTLLDYSEIVLKPLEPMFNNKYNTIVLWFGTDMFCQINMMTILAYLDMQEFTGDVLFCAKNELTDEMLPDAFEIDIKGSYDQYKSILCDHEMPGSKMLPVMYQAVTQYLSYRLPNSEINQYIKKNIQKERIDLIKDLLTNFPQYGLGDLQYEMLINDFETKNMS